MRKSINIVLAATVALMSGCATTESVTVTYSGGKPSVHVSFKPYSGRSKPYMATKAIKQHESIIYWSSTDVAECVSGLGDDIYKRLWELCEDKPFTEEPVYESQNWWMHLTPEQQMHINECCKAEFDA